MLNKRLLLFYVILTVVAVVLQAAPRILGDVFIFIVILGGFPVYTAARLNWAWGTVVYLAAAFICSIMDVGEALFFICTNGVIGLSLGIMKNRFKSIYLQPIPSALIVIILLSAINNLLGISIFGYSPLRTPLQQVLTLIAPLYIYCLLYLKLAMSADNLFHKHIDLYIS